LASQAPPSSWRDEVFVETALNPERGQDRPGKNRGRAVITAGRKYMVWQWGKYREHLVDLKADPGEMVNRAVSCRAEGELLEMRKRLQAWVQRTGDTFEVPGYALLSPTPGWKEVEILREKRLRGR
jgi:hypothetical protein